jgi:hypothetical protein
MAGLKLDLDNLERVQLQPWTCKGKDLWLISIPNDIGVESLVGKKLHINGQSSSSEFLDESTYAQIENKKSTNVIPASTKETSGRLKLGRQCKGEISIRKHIRLMKQDLSSLVETKGIPEIPAGLKQRWKPFGIKSTIIHYY